MRRTTALRVDARRVGATRNHPGEFCGEAKSCRTMGFDVTAINNRSPPRVERQRERATSLYGQVQNKLEEARGEAKPFQ
jgi:hypothetical protein